VAVMRLGLAKWTGCDAARTPAFPTLNSSKSHIIPQQLIRRRFDILSLFESSQIMPRASRETEIYRHDAKKNQTQLTPAEREKLIAVSYLGVEIEYVLTKSIALSPYTSFAIPVSPREWPKHSYHPSWQAQNTVRIGSSNFSKSSIACSGLCYNTHHLLCIYPDTSGISCCKRSYICYSILPPSNAGAYSEGREGAVTAATASECDFEAGRWRKGRCWARGLGGRVS
jgi:hypothetical protein